MLQYPKMETVCHDVSDWDKTRKVVEGLGYFNCLFNNCGILDIVPFLDKRKGVLHKCV
jgi:L-xylulose reductase